MLFQLGKHREALQYFEMEVRVTRNPAVRARLLFEKGSVLEHQLGMSAEAMPLALSGDREGALAAMEAWKAENGGNPRNELEIHAAVGDRAGANKIAAEMDARAGGPMFLLISIEYCACGALFDLESTPNFRARINEMGMDWPPPRLIDFPLKIW